MGVGRSEEEAGARFWVLVIAPRTRAGPSSSSFRFRGCQGLLVLLLRSGSTEGAEQQGFIASSSAFFLVGNTCWRRGSNLTGKGTLLPSSSNSIIGGLNFIP